MRGIATSRRHNCRRIAVVAAAVATVTLLPASSAFGQGALDQYSPTRPAPIGQPSAGSETGGEAVPGAALGPAAFNASDASAAGDSGELPVTGYPLTPLIIALLILLATGVALRLAVEVHSRWNTRD